MTQQEMETILVKVKEVLTPYIKAVEKVIPKAVVPIEPVFTMSKSQLHQLKQLSVESGIFSQPEADKHFPEGAK